VRGRADNTVVTVRTTLTVVVLVALAFGAWRVLAPRAERASNEAGESADALVGTVSRAYFTAAEASLHAHRSATGSYAGTPLQPPVTLVRADASSYCIQLDRPPVQEHLDGPGGVATAGPCG
jgi:hypothetical protein